MKTPRIIFVVVFIISLAAAGLCFSFYRYATTPVQSSEKSVIVWIKPGQSFSETVAELQKAGLIRHPIRFRLLAYLQRDERRIRAAEYQLRTSMSPRAILETLVRGKGLLHKVVIPEGSSVRKIGQLLDKAGLVSEKDFLKAALDPDLIRGLDMEGDSLEGYLFPETYYVAKGVSAEAFTRRMVAHFHSVFTPAWVERARAMGLTVRQVVTIASMVEKETGKPEERPLIAAVFLNRLKRGIRLESDPTVIYGIKDFDGNLTRKDLETPTPYNTYQIAGLPQGPIANPGRASIEAVLYPAEQPYLYFVSKNDGSHHFSSTLAEHNAMVEQYQRRRSGRP